MKENEQEALKNEYKYAIRYIRNEIKYFSSFKFQWFYNIRLKRKSKDSNVWEPSMTKSKPKSTFVNVNKLSKKIFGFEGGKEVRLQKCNIIADQIG